MSMLYVDVNSHFKVLCSEPQQVLCSFVQQYNAKKLVTPKKSTCDVKT